MEDLIAAYPDDFFPRHTLKLRARQKTYKGIGRFDLHFVDQFGSNILMELKAVPARYEDASQLARYRDAMKAAGDERIIMWLIAPLIPPSVREFLAHIGIEYSEIHEPEFHRVAGLRGFNLGIEKVADVPNAPATAQLPSSTRISPQKTSRKGGNDDRAWHFNTDESEVPGRTAHLIESSHFALWGYADTAKKLNAPAEGESILFYQNGVGVIAAGFIGPQLATSSNDVFGKQAEGEHKRVVLELIAVSKERAVTAKELRTLGITVPVHGLCRRYPKQIAEEVRALLETRSR